MDRSPSPSPSSPCSESCLSILELEVLELFIQPNHVLGSFCTCFCDVIFLPCATSFLECSIISSFAAAWRNITKVRSGSKVSIPLCNNSSSADLISMCPDSSNVLLFFTSRMYWVLFDAILNAYFHHALQLSEECVGRSDGL